MKFLYFSAPWCGPCKMLGPVMNRVAEKHEVVKINVDEQPNVASHYGVRNIPTVLLVDNEGNVVDKAIGTKKEQDYYDMFEEAAKQ